MAFSHRRQRIVLLRWPSNKDGDRRKQYNTKIVEWGMEKNIKRKEMNHIVRKDMQRRAENPTRKSAFRLRKQPVPAGKIDRYKKENGANLLNAEPAGSELLDEYC